MAIFGSDDRTISNYANIFQGRGSKGNFTGFLVSDDLVLTVKHALPGRGFSFETPEGSIKARNVYAHPSQDYALFQLEKPLRTVTPLALDKPDRALLKLGTTLVGYHADFPGQTESTERDSRLAWGDIHYEHDAFRGSSGGPLLDFRGVAIGVNYAATNGYNMAVSVSNEMLEQVAHYDGLVGEASYDFALEETDFDTPEVARFLNLENHSHFYTSDEETIRDLASSDQFVREHSSILDNGEGDVHVFYVHPTRSFFYTSDYNEVAYVLRELDHYELVDSSAFGVDDEQVHRLYNPINGAHFFTESDFEATWVEENLGFVNEGFL